MRVDLEAYEYTRTTRALSFSSVEYSPGASVAERRRAGPNLKII